jgi:hypothetical protein
MKYKSPDVSPELDFFIFATLTKEAIYIEVRKNKDLI